MILVKVATDCSQAPPSPDSLAVKAAIWKEALAAIPTHRLEEVSILARQAHRTAFPLTTGEMLVAWDGLLASLGAGTALALPAGPPAGDVCPACGGMVWLKDYAGGALVRCPDCLGQTAPPGAGQAASTNQVRALLEVLRDWAREKRDQTPFPRRLRYALACREAGAPPHDLRNLLEATGKSSLYEALTDLGIPVEPPPDEPVGPPDPREMAAHAAGWRRIGNLMDL